MTLRAGFMEALGRRAGFTRRHRGAFAAPLSGSAGDSSAAPAGWHAGDRVLFAWHQDDSLHHAAFDVAGRPVGEVQALGAGRWPRIIANERLSAVAWVQGDTVAVRLHDGTRWQEPAMLAGREAAIAFGPDDAVVAATGDGLWRLTAGGATRLGDGSYARPALAVDRRGEPHVAWERDGDVWCDGEAIGRGERPSLVAGADGSLHVAWTSGDAVHVRARTNGSWAAAVRIPMRAPSWATPAFEGDRVRLTCFGGAPSGPPALWLVRLPDPAPILMPSVSGNVTHAWLMHHFELRYPRSSYRPHDMDVAFNGQLLQAFEKDVMEGRCLFRLDPSQVRTSPGRPVANIVNVSSRHMNGGSYIINNRFNLITQTAWGERWGFATSEAELLADRPENVNEAQPDLVLLASTLGMPLQAPEPGLMFFDVTVVNIGEARSDRAELVLMAGERELYRAPVRPLDPGDDLAIGVPYYYDGRTTLVTLRLAGSDREFSAASNVLPLHLWDRRSGSPDPGSATMNGDAVSRAVPEAADPAPAPLPAGEPMTDFTLPRAVDPGVFRLADHSGKVVLLNWWRTSCPLSEAEAPRLAGLYRRYRDQGFEILGISDDPSGTVSAIPAYRDRHGITWPLALNDQGEFLREIVPPGQHDTPANYLVTRRGRLIRLGLDRSPDAWARIEETVAAAVAEPAPSAAAVVPRAMPATPPLAGAGLDGRPIAIGDYAGRPVVINFFNADTCDWAGAALAALDARYRARGLHLIGVNLFDGDDAVRACLQRHGITYPVIRGTADLQRDWLGSVSAWGTFFVTADGRIAKSILNSLTHGLESEVFWRYAEHLLAGRGGAGRPA